MDGGSQSASASAPPPEEGPELLVFTRAAAREVDRLAAEQYGIPSLLLMENAAIHLADVALHLLQDAEEPSAMVFCGPGSNGGDGLALARHLHNASVDVRVALAAPRTKYSGDAATNLGIVERMGLAIIEADGGPEGVESVTARTGRPELVVDALVGTGLDREVRGSVAALIGTMNRLRQEGSVVLAVDLPSGLNADTGEPLGAAVQADVTVSFVGLKHGFTNLTAQNYLGEVIIADIGVPRELAHRLGQPFREGAHPDRPPAHRPEGDGDRRTGGQRGEER